METPAEYLTRSAVKNPGPPSFEYRTSEFRVLIDGIDGISESRFRSIISQIMNSVSPDSNTNKPEPGDGC